MIVQNVLGCIAFALIVLMFNDDALIKITQYIKDLL